MWSGILLIPLVAVLVFCIRYLKAEHAREQAEKARAKRWRPRYLQDLHRAHAAMTGDELAAYATQHYKRIIVEYRKRNAAGEDPYWTRGVQPLPDEYLEYLCSIEQDQLILHWYTEPEMLFNLALAVRATKTPADENTEWKLECNELPLYNVDEFRRKIEDGDDAAA